MAVDTAHKRFSMLDMGGGAVLHLLFEPDGTVDLDDRQHLLGCYSGIAFVTPLDYQDRLSFLNFGDGTTIHVLFEADGSVDLNDKQHMLDLYSGVALGLFTPGQGTARLL